MQSVLVTADALRADHLSQYGYHRDTLPALDRFCSDGTRFEHAYANGPHSGVSIPSFLTSRHRGEAALADGPTVASVLADAGYRTAAFHSNTLVANQFDRMVGFETYEDFDIADNRTEHRAFEKSFLDRIYGGLALVSDAIADRSTVVRTLHERFVPPEHRFDFQVYVDAETVTDRVLGWLSDHADEEFFLWVHYMDPHRPYGIDPDDLAYVDTPISDETIQSLMSRAGTDDDSLTADERSLLEDLYDSDLRYLSEHLDRLFDGIERTCGSEDTLIAFTADHGEEFRDHGMFFHRNHPYDELLHVPLLVRHPDHDRRRVEGQRSLVDLAPTICAFHDVPPDEGFEGRDLFEATPRDVYATGSFRGDGTVAAVRTPEWKYIVIDGADDELYHLVDDPAERRDVASRHPDRAAVLRDRIPESLTAGTPTQPPTDVAGDTERRLEHLGYLE
ncbi:MAG: sulfatase [Halapricum sp.]